MSPRNASSGDVSIGDASIGNESLGDASLGPTSEVRGGASGACWTKAAIAALLVLVLGACISLAFSVHPWYEATDETNDASMYIITARSLLAGEGYTYLGQPFTVRPPGFSFLLVPLIAWRGLDFQALNLLVSLFGVAGVAFLYALILPRLGTLVSSCIAAALWMNPAYQHMCNQVMTDVPGTALGLGCLLVERWADRRPGVKRDALLGLCIGLASYVRTVNVMLVPAILLARSLAHWTRKGEKPSWASFARARGVIVPLVAVSVLAPWSIRCAFRHPTAPVDQNYLYSYSSGMWNTDPADPSSPRKPIVDVLARAPVRARQLVPVLGGRLRSEEKDPLLERVGLRLPPETLHTLHGLAGVMLLAFALVTLVVRRRTSELFMAAVILVLLVYFGFRDRLVLPVYALALPAAAEMLIAGLQRMTSASAAACRVAIAVSVVAVALLDLSLREGWTYIESAHRSYVEACANVAPRLASDVRLAAPIGWHYSVYLDRPVHSMFFAARRKGSILGAEEAIDRYGINTALFTSFMGDDRGMQPYFEKKYGAGLRAGTATIIRVRP